MGGGGTYDSNTGIWSVGILPAGGDATMELILQANNAGYFVNLVSVYGDLVLFSTKSLSSAPKGVVKAWSVKAASSMPDSNPGNNQASYDITSIDPEQTADTNTFTYDFPPVTPPTQPQPPNNPPTPPGPTPPEPQPPGPTPPNNPLHPTGQLGRDIAGVRNAVSSGSTDDNIPEWNPGQDNTNSNSNSDIYEVINHLKFILDMLMLLDDISTILFLISLSALLIWALFAVLGSLGVFTGLFVIYCIALFLIAIGIVIYFTARPYIEKLLKEIFK
ncbi:MAG: hypothetical protein PQ975_05390 [Methanobacterium sp.]|jgi:hypothetical protein